MTTTEQDQATIADLAATIADLAATIADLTHQLHAAEHRAREAAAAAAEAEREIVVLQDNAKMDATEIVRLNAEIAEWDERYTGEGRARFECAEHVDRLQAQIATLEAEVTRYRRLADYDRLRKHQ